MGLKKHIASTCQDVALLNVLDLLQSMVQPLHHMPLHHMPLHHMPLHHITLHHITLHHMGAEGLKTRKLWLVCCRAWLEKAMISRPA